MPSSPPLPPLHLVPSEDLPAGWTEQRLPDPARAAAQALLRLSPDCPSGAASATADMLHGALVPGAVFGPDPRACEGNLKNDTFFGVVRVSGPPCPVLLRATAQAYGGLLDELAHAGTTLEAAALHDLGAALAAAVAAASATGPPDGPLPLPHSPADPVAATDEPLRRWRRGHHLFMALIQALAVTADGLRVAVLKQEDHLRADQWELLTVLLRGSGAALRFTGDFAGRDYISEVRPLMSDPVVPDGMTGLDLRDHAHLIARLRGLGEAVRTGCSDVSRAGSAAFRAELGLVYAAHTVVCSEFVGADATSLIVDEGPSAVDALGRLAAVRGRLLPDHPDHLNHAVRTCPEDKGN